MIGILTGSHNSKIIEEWRTSYPSCTGYKIAATEVHNIVKGTVGQVGQSGNTYVVTILCNPRECIRYGNITKTELKEGDTVAFGQLIGKCQKYVLFEYCSVAQSGSLWPVRINDKSFYKHNPKEILDGTYIVPEESLTSKRLYTPVTRTISDEQLSEFVTRRSKDV